MALDPRMTPSILLASGAYFDFERLNVEDVTIEDVAHALAHICRFTGHCRRPAWWPFSHYSVAQHSVLVSEIVPPELAYQGLGHDIGEALYGDMAAPVKQLLPDFKALERRVEVPLFERFGLPFPLDPRVKHADLVALSTEKVSMMHRNAGAWVWDSSHPPLQRKVRPWPIWYAKRRFLARYYELVKLPHPMRVSKPLQVV